MRTFQRDAPLLPMVTGMITMVPSVIRASLLSVRVHRLTQMVQRRAVILSD